MAGKIISADITVKQAYQLKDFYQRVMNWEVEEMPMRDGEGSYSDYIMKDGDGNWVGGVCNKRGVNTDFPHQWIVYVSVSNVAESIEKCRALGGKVVKESINAEGKYNYVLIEDPLGAVIGLTEHK